MRLVSIATFALLSWGMAVSAATPQKTLEDLKTQVREVIKRRQYKWDASVFSMAGLQVRHFSVQGYPLGYYTCGDAESKNRSLVLSAVHGDEVTPVYFGFRLVDWLKANPEVCRDKFIVIAPLVNPDGFFRYTRGTRTNWNKVDLNRNFDTPEWTEKAHHLWKTRFASQRRYFPGDTAASEPETEFQKWLIATFRPTKIMSVHAPLNILDYDGPGIENAQAFTRAYVDSCEALNKAVSSATTLLKFFPYGAFPGSLGNYAGQSKGVPTFTVELPTAKADEAPFYFGDMEKGNRLFFEYELAPRPDPSIQTSAAPK